MRYDSTALQAPFLGPAPAGYPPLRQIVRADKPAGPVWSGFMQQWSDKIGRMRDREPCYIWEPNQLSLLPNIFRARLVGSYEGLPLYIASMACCRGISSSASPSSASPSSSSPSSSVSPSSSSLSPSPSGSPSLLSSLSAKLASSSLASASSQAAGTIPTICCGSVLLPGTIHLSFTGTLSHFPSVPCSFVVGQPNPTWSGSEPPDGFCGCNALPWAFSLVCNANGSFKIGAGNPGDNPSLSVSFQCTTTTFSCSPLMISCSGTVVTTGSCAGTAGAIATV